MASFFFVNSDLLNCVAMLYRIIQQIITFSFGFFFILTNISHSHLMHAIKSICFSFFNVIVNETQLNFSFPLAIMRIKTIGNKIFVFQFAKGAVSFCEI